jgi:hypothetical protein
MKYAIVPPEGGTVTLTLDWDDAEILVRALGMVNTGSLRHVSPNLDEFMTSALGIFGRNFDSEANRYIAESHNRQVYIEKVKGS